MRPGERGADPVCVVPHVVIDPARDGPLRLHDGQYAFQAPPPPGLDAPGQLAFVERYLISRTDPFSKAQGLLIERYFAHLRARIEDARIALCDRLGPLRSVFDYRAFAFAAPRPLPRAYLALPGEGFLRLDCAFWMGRHALAIEVVAGDTPSLARTAQLARLRAAGTAICWIDPRTPCEAELAALFPCLWDGVALPSGPFKARGIEAFAALPG